MDLEIVVTPGLGNNSYLLGSDGEAVVVDPQRDVDRILAAAERRGAAIRFVLETHVHNDYVSGAAEIRARTGATIAGPAGAGYGFEHLGIEEGAELRIGSIRLVGMHTPGHTPEHVSYAVHEAEGPAPAAVFTGGSLIVGSTGRTDLLGPDRTDELTRAQFRSLRRLGSLPDATLVLPTHGAGSFCAAGTAGERRTSTIADERSSNPALAPEDEETFVREQLAGLMARPTYYERMAPINRAGPPVVGGVPIPSPLGVEETASRLGKGATLVDGRHGRAFADAHVPGSVNIPLDEAFASYVGWIVSFDYPIVLLLPEPEPASLLDAATQLFRIGREHVVGHLQGGVAAWEASGGKVRRYPRLSADELAAELASRPLDAGGPAVLDVRQRAEWDAGHLPGSRHVFVGDLPGRLGEFDALDTELTIACASGHRSSIAASVLDGKGVRVRLVEPGGIPRVIRRLGQLTPQE